jgi:hypothetical protein
LKFFLSFVVFLLKKTFSIEFVRQEQVVEDGKQGSEWLLGEQH